MIAYSLVCHHPLIIHPLIKYPLNNKFPLITHLPTFWSPRLDRGIADSWIVRRRRKSLSHLEQLFRNLGDRCSSERSVGWHRRWCKYRRIHDVVRTRMSSHRRNPGKFQPSWCGGRWSHDGLRLIEWFTHYPFSHGIHASHVRDIGDQIHRDIPAIFVNLSIILRNPQRQ